MNTVSNPSGQEDAHFHIEVGNHNLQFTTVTLDDPVPTGAQILDAAGLRPTRDHFLFQVLTDGTLKETRAERLTDTCLTPDDGISGKTWAVATPIIPRPHKADTIH